jgi:hypothetical protein
MQREIRQQIDTMRVFEDPQEPAPSMRQPLFTFGTDNGPPLSPRQIPQSDSRRPSLANINNPQPTTTTTTTTTTTPFKAPVAPHLAISPRRYGSISTGSYSPSSARTPVHQVPPPPPPQIQHPLSTSMSANSPPANLSRRHTSADIRLHGWQPQGHVPSHSPYASGHNSTQWPSSPHRTPIGGPAGGADQALRDQLASYELSRGPRQGGSRQPSPPPAGNDPMSLGSNNDAGWTLPGARFPFKGLDTSAPPTRRSSMASNVHSLLNPAETAEREGEDDGVEDRKRKRMQ